MASSLRSWSVPGLLMSLLVLLVVCPASISASSPKRPHTLTVYVHENRGQNATLRAVTNSTLGVIDVLNQPLREGRLPTSKLIGTQSGLASIFFSGDSALYSCFDFHIQSAQYNGNLQLQGAQNLSLPVRTLPVIGGTGDFYLARGYATIKTVAATATTGVYQYALRFTY